MIALLNEILRMLGGLFGKQDDVQAAIETHLKAQDAAIEHLRQLIEGDTAPLTVNFTEVPKP